MVVLKSTGKETESECPTEGTFPFPPWGRADQNQGGSKSFPSGVKEVTVDLPITLSFNYSYLMPIAIDGSNNNNVFPLAYSTITESTIVFKTTDTTVGAFRWALFGT